MRFVQFQMGNRNSSRRRHALKLSPQEQLLAELGLFTLKSLPWSALTHPHDWLRPPRRGPGARDLRASVGEAERLSAEWEVLDLAVADCDEPVLRRTAAKTTPRGILT